jgi:hypothetical protein
MNTQSNDYADYVQFDEPLREAYSRLDRALLVPLSDDGEVLRDSHGVPFKTPSNFEASQTAAYLRELSTSAIGVLCGAASDDLYAVGFTNPQVLKEFLQNNPTLLQTATLSGPGGIVFFFRVPDFCPRTTELPGCKWYGAKAIVPIRLRRKFTTNYEWSKGCKPMRIDFSQIHWSPEVESIFRPQVVQGYYHTPFLDEGKGRRILNYSFWACYFSLEARVRFCIADERFYKFDCNVLDWLVIPVGQIKADLHRFLLQQGRKREFAPLLRPRSKKELNELIQALRIVAIGQFGDAVKALERFVTECLEKHGDSDITVEEMFVAFCSFCRLSALPVMTRARFLDEGPRPIKQVFGIGRSNSIIRNGTARRGYHNLRLKLSVAPSEDKSECSSTREAAPLHVGQACSPVNEQHRT